MLLLLFLFLFSFSLGLDDIYNEIYTSFSRARPCVRLLSQYGGIGCATPSKGLKGTLRYLPNEEAVNNLISSPPSYKVAAVLEQEVFGRDIILNLTDAIDLAGIILLYQAPNPGYSSDLSWPQETLDIHYPPQSPGFKWNSLGDGLAMEEFPFAIVALTDSNEILQLRKLAQANDKSVQNNEFAAEAAEFNYRMYAETNSMACLDAAKCLPVGGYSVWAPFGSVNTSKEQVFGIAGSDSTALFHDYAIGAIADTSGTVALLAAAQALTAVDVLNLERQIVIALFTGEAWGYVGSRMFTYDIQYFHCDVNASDGTCSQPYRPSLEFEKLNISRISRILELNQVGYLNSSSTFFMHREHDLNAGVDSFIADIETQAEGVEGLTVANASRYTPGVPPSSSQAFLAARSDIPTIVLTNHYQEYSNLDYHSIYDSTMPAYSAICAVATLTARTLWVSAGGALNAASNITADCSLVQTLLDCLVNDATCDFVNSYTQGEPQNPPDPVTHYTSVYQLMLRKHIAGLTLFYYNYLDGITGNATLKSTNGAFSNSTAEYHDAVDPALIFDYGNSMWTWNKTALALNQTFLWTESNWASDIGIRAYRMESSKTEVTMLVLGCILITATAILTILLQNYFCNKKFKPL